jgi:hypothetical protein
MEEASGTDGLLGKVCYRFLAPFPAIAFGHPGFLVYERGIPNALWSYYMLQHLHN